MSNFPHVIYFCFCKLPVYFLCPLQSFSFWIFIYVKTSFCIFNVVYHNFLNFDFWKVLNEQKSFKGGTEHSCRAHMSSFSFCYHPTWSQHFSPRRRFSTSALLAFWHWEILGCGAVLCVVGCLAPSPASILDARSKSPSLPSCTSKNVSIRYYMFPQEQNHPQWEFRS